MKRKLLTFLCFIPMLFTSSCGKEDNRIEVSFSWNFETTIEAPSSIKVMPGEAYGTLPTPSFERDGFTFGGWNIRRDGKGDVVTAETLVEEDAIDHTLYAKWLGKQYTVSFDLHGGNINGATTLPDATVTCGNIYGAMVIPNDPTKKLGTFLGWYLNAEGTGEEITYSSKVTLAKDHTLHAVYKDTKLSYTFDSDKDLEDFAGVYDALDLKVNNGQLEIKNVSDDPRAYMTFTSRLRAGSAVEIDAEFVGEANAEEGVRAGMYVYGLSGDNRGIAGGYRGDPGVASTREEIKNWYYGQGANNVQAWELEKWNNGHILLNMNILEDCYGVYFMFDFGRKTIESETIDLNPELWQNNTWVIHSIQIDYADYDALKDSYDFTDESDLDSFIHPQNVKYAIDSEDNTLKIEKGNTDEKSYLEFETQYLTAGSRVDFEITYFGDDAFVSGNPIGVFTYGNYPNGKMLTGKTGPNGFDVAATDDDTQRVKDFYWGSYGTTNEPWCENRLSNGQKISFTNYIYEDCYGITLWFKFGTVNGYFKISNVVVHRDEPLSEFDFSREKQLDYFKTYTNIDIALDGDNNGDFLKVTKSANATCSLTLKTLIKKGQTVTVSLSYVTSNADFNSGGQFTYLIHKANQVGNSKGGSLAVIGNASWDGGWDSSEYAISATFDDDCYGAWMQFVFNNDAKAYFRISSITIA